MISAEQQAITTKIYVGSLNFDLQKEHIKELFSPFGPIQDITMQQDPTTKKSKGYCFVNFYHQESALEAIAEMDKFTFCGRQIKVNFPSGVNPAPSLLAKIKPQSIPNQKNRVYVGSIPWNVSSESLKEIFSVVGEIVSCQLIPNPETGKHKGYGFIEFTSERDAERAKEAFDGFSINDRKIKVRSPSAV